MILPTAGHLLGSYRTPTYGNLLLLLLGIGWVQPLRIQVAETGQEAVLLDQVLANTSDFASPSTFPGPQACARLFSHITKAHVDELPWRASERRQLLLAVLACQGVHGSLVHEADERALGGLACELPGHFVVNSAEVLLPRLAGCPGPLDQDQQAAASVALQGGGPPYGPSRWSVSTLDALQGLLAVLDQPIIQDIPKGVMTTWLQRNSKDPSWRRPELTAVLMRLRRYTESRKPDVVDENLIFYEEWELEACVDGVLLDAQMDRVNAIPFTYQQIHIFKCRLDQTYPQGYPESLVQRLGYFFRYVSPEDIRKWNLTSLETVKALLSISKGRKMDAQVTALIDHYVLGGGQLDKDIMDTLADFRPDYLCFLSPEQLGSVPHRVMWAIRPQDLDLCDRRQLGILYSKACLAFQNVSQSEHFGKIQAFLGGAPMEDLRALILQNVTMDMATFKKLQAEAVVGLTVSEVQKLLGPHVGGLKAEEDNSPVRDWISRQQQEDLDMLGLGLHGGIPNGYLVLDFSFQEAFSEACPLCGPGLLLPWIPTLLMASTLS